MDHVEHNFIKSEAMWHRDLKVLSVLDFNSQAMTSGIKDMRKLEPSAGENADLGSLFGKRYGSSSND